MQVGALGSGDLLRILEAILKLPNPSEARNAGPAIPAPAPAREDEAVLQYAAVSQFVQAMGNPSTAVSRATSQTGVSVQQAPEAIAELPKLDPAIAAAVAATVVLGSGHVAALDTAYGSYAIHSDGTGLAQTPVTGSIYAAAFSQATDYACRSDVMPVREATDSAGRRWTGLGSSAWSGTRRLWTRAPLLVLLLGWLAAGLCTGTAAILFAASAAPVNAIFEVWAIGFLAIVCFGFYARVRSIQFPRRAKR